MQRFAKLIEFENRSALTEHLASRVTEHISRALETRGTASMALSGGSSPSALYKELSTKKLDWRNVFTTLVDDRWVAPGEEGSNETFLKSTLLQNNAQDAQFVGLWSDAASPKEGLGTAERRLADIPAPFDIVILGMGPDGHTASWFPHAEGLKEALGSTSRLAAVTAKPSPVTGAHLQRITLTLGAVSETPFLCLLITGADKKTAFEAALSDGAVEDMPVRAILDARPDISVFWAP